MMIIHIKKCAGGVGDVSLLIELNFCFKERKVKSLMNNEYKIIEERKDFISHWRRDFLVISTKLYICYINLL